MGKKVRQNFTYKKVKKNYVKLCISMGKMNEII